ncbi:hypothetical protein DGMP_14640 [Desulfomarina profundi]|uniref:Uncharacterized protein n=1 Tax=Desulfomarina profundi TaxID=2772557 RepID=A0A8D5JR72_9BACT|nr:hypothetical protein DGMP_14640 [Desulfomarina profundi]
MDNQNKNDILTCNCIAELSSSAIYESVDLHPWAAADNENPTAAEYLSWRDFQINSEPDFYYN